jgi:hypothetical protein
LVTPNANPWLEAVRSIVLNMPFGASIGAAATQRGIPRMSLGQVLQPMIQQRENARLWDAFKAGGLLPEGTDPAPLQAAGVDPRIGITLMRQMNQNVPLSSIPGYIETMLPEATPEERARYGQMKVPRTSADDLLVKMLMSQNTAKELKRAYEAAGVPAGHIGGIIDPTSATTYREQLRTQVKDLQKERDRQRLVADVRRVTGTPIPDDTSADAAERILQAYQQQQYQTRGFAQQERLRGMTEAGLISRQAQTQAMMSDREDVRQQKREVQEANRNYVKGFEDIQKDARTQILKAQQTRDIERRKINQLSDEHMVTPAEAASRRRAIQDEYEAAVGPLEDQVGLAGLQIRMFNTPFPKKQFKMSAEDLEAQLAKTDHDPDYQKNLLANTYEGLASHVVVGLTPIQYYDIRRRWLERRGGR